MTIALIYPYEETSVIAVPFHLAFNIKVAAAGFLIKVYLISSSSWRMGPLAWGGLRLNPSSQDPITVTDTTVRHLHRIVTILHCNSVVLLKCAGRLQPRGPGLTPV